MYDHNENCISCVICRGLKLTLTPLLARLLECDGSKMMKFDEFFDEVLEICGKCVINVFHSNTSTLLKIYINTDHK